VSDLTNPDPAAARLTRARAARAAARQTVEARVQQVQADLAARGIGRRIAAKAGDEVRAALDETTAIARESKGIIAVTTLALALWAARNPLTRFMQAKLDNLFAPDGVQDS
jgi:hypothetical protein